MQKIKSKDKKKKDDGKTVVEHVGNTLKNPLVVSLRCPSLLSAYRLTQSYSRNRPYKFTPGASLNLQTKLTINSWQMLNKLASPRREKKEPYVPNRDIMRLFGNTEDDREREKLMLENEEFLYKNKEYHHRTGQFFGSQNPELLERFQTTHEYIKKLYEHSKGKQLFQT